MSLYDWHAANREGARRRCPDQHWWEEACEWQAEQDEKQVALLEKQLSDLKDVLRTLCFRVKSSAVELSRYEALRPVQKHIQCKVQEAEEHLMGGE